MSTTITQKRYIPFDVNSQNPPPLVVSGGGGNGGNGGTAQSQQLIAYDTTSNSANTTTTTLVKYADIDDIELPDGSKIGYPTESEIKRMQEGDAVATTSDSISTTLGEKYSILAASALKNFDIVMNDSLENASGSDDPNAMYACRHCGKKYRWKSTLRRHEKDECGGKEPAHQCPYCSYKAKQRGNLGVHLRKHHSDKPQLESRRKKRSMDLLIEENMGGGGIDGDAGSS